MFLDLGNNGVLYIHNEKTGDKLDPVLILLINYAKTNSAEVTWKTVRAALASEFHPEMRFTDVFRITFKSFLIALNEPRFQIPHQQDQSLVLGELILSPIQHWTAIDLYGPKDLSVHYTIQQFYEAMIKNMISALKLSRQDWCRDQLTLG